MINWEYVNLERGKLIEKLKKRLSSTTQYYPGMFRNYVKNLDDNLITPLTSSHREQINLGDGGELKWWYNEKVGCEFPPKMQAVHSSSALIYNLLSYLDCGNLFFNGECFKKVEFEKKLPTLKEEKTKDSNETNHPCANIDAYLESKEEMLFIENKFVEPYYSPDKKSNKDKTKEIKAAYLHSTRYLFDDQATIKKWNDLFRNKFEIYDGNQMMKHMLAIYSDVINNPNKYCGYKEIVLLNLVWSQATEPEFRELYSVDKEYKAEGKKSIDKFNDFLNNLVLPQNLKFKVLYLTYAEFLNEKACQNNEKTFDYIKNRYILN